jgi:Zn-dependent metalloprotease
MFKDRCLVITVFIIMCLNLIGFVKPAAAQRPDSASKRFKDRYGGEKVRIIRDQNTNLPKEINNLNFLLPDLEGKISIEKGDIAGAVLGFIEENSSFLGIDLRDLHLVKGEKIGQRWFVTFEQYYREIPVYHVKIGAVVSDSGKIISFSSDYIPEIEIPLEPGISLDDAGTIARNTYDSSDQAGLIPKEGVLVVFPQISENSPNRDIHLAWKFLLQAELVNPEIDQYFIVDALNGEILVSYPAFVEATISGKVKCQVFPALPTDPLVTVPCANDSVIVGGADRTATNATGGYSITGLSPGNYTVNSRLEGPFAKVYDYSGVDFTHSHSCATSGNCNWTWVEDPATAVEETDGINVFYHLNLLHDQFYQGILGYSWANAWTNNPQMQAQVNGSFNNAYAGNPILFGNDPYARSCDVVYHEATHNVMYNIFSDWIGYSYGYGTEGAAMDEGFADYFACAFTNDSRLGEGCGITRNVDNTMTYPYPYSGGAHNEGQIISGAVWDLRTDFGLNMDDVDNLAFQALNIMATKPFQYYFSDPNHSNFFTSILEADDNNSNLLDGTPHDREIFQAFRNHDLLPVDVFCKDGPMDDGNVPSVASYQTNPDIWVRNIQDGGTTHQQPIFNQANFIYVKVRNLGYLSANSVKAKVYWADPDGNMTWPSDWNFIGETSVANLGANSETVVGPITWIPPAIAAGNKCLLARLECDQEIPMMTEEDDVVNENNIARKNIFMLPPPPTHPNYRSSLHTGVAIPVGSYADDFGRGLNVVIDMERYLLPELSLIGFVGYNLFESKTTGINDTYWFNFSLNLRYYKQVGAPWFVYAGIGPGIYKPETGSNEFGGNVGFGVDYHSPIPYIVFELGTDFHMIFDPDIQFLHIHAGVIREF